MVGSGARLKLEWRDVMPGIVNYSSVVILVSPFMPISVDQIPRIHWIADVIIYIFAVRRNRYRCCLCLVLIHWFTNLLHLHTVLTCILNFHEDISKYCLISLKLKKTAPNPCVNVKCFSSSSNRSFLVPREWSTVSHDQLCQRTAHSGVDEQQV